MNGEIARTSLPASLFYVEADLRWTARVLAVCLVGLVLAIYIGEGGPTPFKLSALEAIQMVFFWTTCLGMVAALRWQVLGGAISAAGMLLFLTVELGAIGRLPRGAVFYLMLLPGILFMVSGFLRKRTAPG
jgi:hypothetical protein